MRGCGRHLSAEAAESSDSAEERHRAHDGGAERFSDDMVLYGANTGYTVEDMHS